MVSWQTMKKVREEYKQYLISLHPEWSANTVSTHISDAFYLANNDCVKSFWQYLVSDESMLEAKAAILDYLLTEAMSERAEDRAKAYYADLCMLKEFLDTEFGGVKARIGEEFNAEDLLFDYCRQAYEGKMTVDEAVEKMSKDIPAFKDVSHKLTIIVFTSMMEGKKYTRRSNMEMTIYFLRRIGQEYGKEKLINALTATQENIQYYYEQTGNKSNGMRRGCRHVAKEYGVEIDFSDEIFTGIIPKKVTDTTLQDDDSSVKYWIYGPGDKTTNWESDYSDGVIAIRWPEIGDLSVYSSKEEMKESFKSIDDRWSYMNTAHATWQFANEMQVGDIIFVKKGQDKIIGRGVVEGEYQYCPDRGEFCHVRKVNWTHKGEWIHPGKAVSKTLTDITSYTDYVKQLLALFGEDMEEIEEEKAKSFDSYTKDDFLRDVYMDEAQYETLTTLLLTNKNIILQGAPGVGKTYAAKRLAFSMMGEKDTDRVKMVQFHQSYSYEDFIMGFRPTATGFELRTGAFYNFCKQAEMDDRPYFFIIDEINRGNLCKIFGELFMLIESDKRDVKLQLLYADEEFSIPSNVHIIGMMNTADRSLAMMDYALRRRFAFYEIEPAFGKEGFKAYKVKLNNPKFDRLIDCVCRLNEVIEKDEILGAGFRIGHSYFCTNSVIDDMWLSNVVKYQLEPLIKEYWFDEPNKVREWISNLRSAIQ